MKRSELKLIQEQQGKEPINWPNYYTPADIAIIDQANKFMDETGFTQAALARLARFSSSSLNQILKGSYLSSPTKNLKMLESAISHAKEGKSDAVQMVETSVFRLVDTACKMARRNRNFSVISAYVGTGKTYALKYYTKHNPNTHLLECNPTYTTKDMVRQLARIVAGYEGNGKMGDCFNAVLFALKDTDSLLIVDEAETLTERQLHTIRRLRDLGNIGIVLAGTEHLTALIKPEYGQFDQIRSRVGFWPETVKQITLEDTAALVQASFGLEEVSEEFIARLYQFSRGSARMLMEGLVAGIHQLRRGAELNVKLVDAVAEQALCLKAPAPLTTGKKP